MINIGIIPLDSRPCNTSWLSKLGNVEDKIKIIMYPIEKCGNLNRGADFIDMFNYIKTIANKLDYLIISVDGFCFGGLVQARLANIDLSFTLSALNTLKDLRKNVPSLKIYVFDTIMRTSITTTSPETAKYWSLMNEYSRLKGLIHFFNKENDKLALIELEQKIPKEIIETYMHAREVKHTLNRYFIQLVKEEIIDYLILLQEDSMPYGIQKKEQDILSKIITSENLCDNVQFYNGTDEGTSVLLAKAMIDCSNCTPKVKLIIPNKYVMKKINLFEDQKFGTNINKMFTSIGLKKTTSINKADAVLGIFCDEKRLDLDLDRYEDIKITKDKKYYNFIKKMKKSYTKKLPVALVDIFVPNGGIPELLNDIDYQKLSIYSAWNTASNSLGSALLELVRVIIYQDDTIHRHFFYERIMDDAIYQYVVRRKINEDLLKNNINIYNLKDKAPAILETIKKEMIKYNYLINDNIYEITLPWNRTFEIDINIKNE